MQGKIDAIQEKVRLGEPVEGEYLTHLLLSDKMGLEEILASITELLVAGVDTVRYTKELSTIRSWQLKLVAYGRFWSPGPDSGPITYRLGFSNHY